MWSSRKQSLADVVEMENRARNGEESGRPKPPATDSPTFCSYWYTRQLPANVRGLRIPWMSQQLSRRVAGWRAHPCTSAHCPRYDDLGDLDMLGVGRCLRPVVVGNGRDHFGHECAQCHGHGTAFG